MAILARQGFHVYLNGHKIHTYIWWLDQPQYRSIVLDKEQTQYLKKGTNVLAVYANDQYSPDSPEHYSALDAWIEESPGRPEEARHRPRRSLSTQGQRSTRGRVQRRLPLFR